MTAPCNGTHEETLDPATSPPVADKGGRRTISRPTSPPNGQVSASPNQAVSGRPAMSLPLLDITNAAASLAAEQRGTARCSPTSGLASREASKSEVSSTAGSSAGTSPRLALTAPPATPTSAPPSTVTDESGHCCGGDISPRQRAREGLAELGIECDWEESDQFYMYVYKVMLCPKKYSHEWSACPFAHKGERATRRDPRHIFYSATSCPDFKSGPCPRGDHCPYSHGVFEACLHPERYRTQLCNSGHNCKRSVCFFAHTLPELRTPTCQPVPPQSAAPTPPPPQPQPHAAGLFQQQHDLLAQLLALNNTPAQPAQPRLMSSPPSSTNNIQELAARMLLGKTGREEPPQATQEDLLRAQLAQYQQTVSLMSSLLAGGGGSVPNNQHSHHHQQPHAPPVMGSRGGVAELLAQLQNQNQHMFPVMHQQPTFSSAMASSSSSKASSKYDVEKLVVDFESGVNMTNLSPRTPFEAPNVSPASNSGPNSHASLLGQQQARQAPVYSTPAPTPRTNYRLFPDDFHYEDRLPANLMESL